MIIGGEMPMLIVAFHGSGFGAYWIWHVGSGFLCKRLLILWTWRCVDLINIFSYIHCICMCKNPPPWLDNQENSPCHDILCIGSFGWSFRVLSSTEVTSLLLERYLLPLRVLGTASIWYQSNYGVSHPFYTELNPTHFPIYSHCISQARFPCSPPTAQWLDIPFLFFFLGAEPTLVHAKVVLWARWGSSLYH